MCTFFSSFFGYSQQPINVLFIGNSFTHMNNMPKMFEQLARSKGKTVFADTIAVSGSTLKAHSERNSTYRKLKTKNWDYVFVQGFSQEFARDTAEIELNSIPYAQQLIDSVLKYSNCANVMFYMTWGYENGIPDDPKNDSYSKMQERISNGYFLLSDTLGYPIAPVGMVWKSIRESNPEIDLYFTDRYHPNLLGSYTAACTFFASIFKESPVGGIVPKRVDQLLAPSIQLAAEKVVLSNFELYKLNQVQYIKPKSTPKIGFKMEEVWLRVQFMNLSAKNASYYWEFGDGTTSTSKNPKHYYDKSGTYTVKLTIKVNCYDYSLKKIIKVSNKVKKGNTFN